MKLYFIRLALFLLAFGIGAATNNTLTNEEALILAFFWVWSIDDFVYDLLNKE